MLELGSHPLILKIDLFRQSSGKWYSGGTVKIEGDTQLWDQDVLDKIENAEDYPLLKGSIRKFFVYVKNVDENGRFFKKLYIPTELEN